MPAARRPLPGVAWVALACLLAAGAVLGFLAPDPHALDWHPAEAGSAPWRLWSAAFVHLSPLHLAGNLAAIAVVAALGWTAAMPGRAAVAWALAWPLTHAGLLAMPALRHYGGLSGVVHAGVAVAAVHLCVGGRGLPRTVGALTLAGLVLKVLSETPWRGPVAASAGWDFPVAPFAHLTGAAAGLLTGAATARRAPAPPDA